MIRLLVFLAVLLGLAFGFAWLADRPGEVSVVWNGTRVDTDLTTMGIGAVVLVVVVLVAIVVLRAVWRAPGSLGAFFGRRRRDKGWAALSRGMIAVGAGDLATAGEASTTARHILGAEPLALLLEAQRAQLAGDREAAKTSFEAMLETPATKLLGLRGLYVEAVRWGDGEAAARFAEAANATAPRLAWAGQALVDHRSQTRDWMGALETIDRNRRNGIVDKATARRLRAVILTADGLDRETKKPDVVRGNALEAHGLAPDLVPAACLAARLLARNGDLKKAAKVLETAWNHAPHPELAETYARLRPGDSVQDRLTRIRELVKVRANHPEGVMALAKAEIEARDFATARADLMPFLSEKPSRRVCLMMAAVEEGEHAGGGAARAWLARALTAPRDPAWVADGFVSDHWAAVSPISGRIDAFEWKVPPEEIAGVVEDPLDEADETLARSGSLVPIETVEAPIETVIDADAAAETASAPAAAEEAPAASATVIELTPTATRTAAPAETVVADTTTVKPVLSHLPDDPGPEEAPPQPEKSRFRLFS